MKQFFLESGADVARAVESEIEAMTTSSSTSTMAASGGAVHRPAGHENRSSSSCAGGSLAYLSILLGLVQQQLIHPKNLVPVRRTRHVSGDAGGDDDEGEDDESLLRLKDHEEEEDVITRTHEEQENEEEEEDEDEDMEDMESSHELDFCLPNPISFSRIKGLESQFKCLMKGSVDLSECDVSHEDGRREVVSRVAHVVWSSLSTDYHSSSSHHHHHHANSSGDDDNDEDNNSSSDSSGGQQHVQFLSSFLSDRRLDSFGVTAAVAAGLQVLFPGNSQSLAHLTLSEDHSWISVSAPDRKWVRVEVTWHAKNDKRLANSSGSHTPDNWLYLKGNHVSCESLALTAVAIICSLNPTIGSNSDSLPLASLQKRLLLFCHSRGLLTRYPMALGSLADLIDLTSGSRRRRQSSSRKSMRLYIESIASSVTHFHDHHIYPYLYLAGFCFRKRKWSESLFNWKKAAVVLSRFNYNPKEDEEAYRELQEIASDLIPHALNSLISGSGGLSPHNYRDLIEFYDGLCGWEEESKWPVLHIGWSKSLVSCLNKFPPDVRSRVVVKVVSRSRRRGLVQDMDDGSESGSGSSSAASSPVPTTREDMASIVEKCSQDPEFLATDSIHRMQQQDPQEEEESRPEEPLVVARVSSAKMGELKDLLVKREKKLNSSAIQLSITAQSSLFSSSSSSSHHHHLMMRHHHHVFSSGHNTRHQHHHRSSPSLAVHEFTDSLTSCSSNASGNDSNSTSTTTTTTTTTTRTPSPTTTARGRRRRRRHDDEQQKQQEKRHKSSPNREQLAHQITT